MEACERTRDNRSKPAIIIMTIELTKEEANLLLQLLDVAVKAGGINAIDPVSIFLRKLQQAEQSQNIG
jgi:hypothetical protein